MSRQNIDAIDPHRTAQPQSEDVASYLLANPSFLARFLDQNPSLIHDLLSEFEPRRDGTTDLRDFIIEKLRQEANMMRRRLQDTIATSRNNLTAQSRTHSAVLAVLSAQNQEDLVQFVSEDMVTILDVDVAMLCAEEEAGSPFRFDLPGLQSLPQGCVDHVIGPSDDFRLDAWQAGDSMFFGEAAGIVRSQALVRLSVSPRVAPALLALGSRRGDQFDAGQGTELLSFLAAILEFRFQYLLEAVR